MFNYRSSEYGGSRGFSVLIASYILATLAMLAKETGITVLGICVAFDWMVLVKNAMQR